MLCDLTVQNYRCFEDFHIDALEQVNLFVGNNNTGKTSLLEAIYLFSSPQTNVALKHILLERQEYVENQYIISNIFTGHKYSANRDILLSSSKNGDRKITIGLNDYSSDTLSIQGNANTELRELGEILLFKERTNDSIAQLLSLQLSNCLYVSTNNRNAKYSAVLWDNISLTPKEDKIIEALQIIEPKVKKIGFSVSQFHQTSSFKNRKQG